MTAPPPAPGTLPAGGEPMPLDGPTWGEALRYWSRLGWVSFGGPAAQIALMHEDLVVRRRWVGEQDFLRALNYCLLLPGPEAQQLATYIGWRLHGASGGIAAGLLFILPSFFILALAAWGLITWGQRPAVQGLMAGIAPVVVALVFVAAGRLARRVLNTPLLRAVAIVAGAAMATGVPFPWIVLTAAAAAYLRNRHTPIVGPPSGGSDPPAEDLRPAHRRPPVAGAARWTLIFGSLWLAGVGLLVLAAVHRSGVERLVDLALFFTQAALLTFGGAYAVLPFVFDAAVEQQRWITAAQMLDGLALGESTPGPLIMVVAYIGFLAAHANDALGAGWPALSGWAGAAVATVFTFLPSFLFILAGAPFIERGGRFAGWSRALDGVSAAVVGIMVELGLQLALRTVWQAGAATGEGSPLPGGWPMGDGALQVGALAVGLLAALALLRGSWSPVRVLLAGGVIGVIAQALR